MMWWVRMFNVVVNWRIDFVMLIWGGSRLSIYEGSEVIM